MPCVTLKETPEEEAMETKHALSMSEDLADEEQDEDAEDEEEEEEDDDDEEEEDLARDLSMALEQALSPGK